MLSGRRGLVHQVQGLHHLREVTGGRVALAAVDQGRHLFGADRLRLPAAGAEGAARGRVRRARHVTFEDDPLALATLRSAIQPVRSFLL